MDTFKIFSKNKFSNIVYLVFLTGNFFYLQCNQSLCCSLLSLFANCLDTDFPVSVWFGAVSNISDPNSLF